MEDLTDGSATNTGLFSQVLRVCRRYPLTSFLIPRQTSFAFESGARLSGCPGVFPAYVSVCLGLTDWRSLFAAHLPLAPVGLLCLSLLDECLSSPVGYMSRVRCLLVHVPLCLCLLSMCPHLSPLVGCKPPSASACWVPICLWLSGTCPHLSLPVGYVFPFASACWV